MPEDGKEAAASHGKGRLVHIDERDKQFPLKALIKRAAPRTTTTRFWNANSWWGDQGDTPQCTAYGWLHWVEDGPITHTKYVMENGKYVKGPDGKKTLRAIPMVVPASFYAEEQALDPWASTPHEGSTVRAGAQALVARNLVGEYRWAFDIETMIDWILTKGPMVVGTEWYRGMEEVDSKGFVHVSGPDDGGHCYVINGVDRKKGFFRIKNSWGRSWGTKGFAKISIEDFGKLLSEEGAEACTAVERK